MVGAEVGEAYDYVAPPVAADEHVFFHVGRRKDEDEESHWLWIDGRTHGPEDWIGDLSASPDGKEITYWTGPGAGYGDAGATTSGEHVLVQATDRGSQWSFARGEKWLDCGAIRRAAGGAIACTLGLERGKGWVVLRAGKRESRLTDALDGIESFALSASGKELAYVRTKRADVVWTGFPTAKDEPQLFLGKKRVGKRHAIVSSATLDAAGKHVAYVVTRDGRRGVAVDDEAEPRGSHDFVTELAFDPPGQRVAFVAVHGGRESADFAGLVEGGEWRVFVRGLGDEPLVEGPVFLDVRDLTWDAASGRLAYAARDEAGWRVISAEQRSDPHSDVGPPVFGAEGKLAFGCRDANQLSWCELELR